ncbi:MAG: DMT family transporter [Burkholderiales bacterium]|nr:DMT family transporter [Burkholderiales bacterium]
MLPLVWSSNYLIARVAATRVPPNTLAFGRWGIVFVVLLVWCRRSLAADPGRLRAEAPRLLVLGALGMWICGAWVYIGGHSTSATNIGLIYAAAPVGIALGGQRLLGEHLGGWQRAALALALVGVVFVVARGEPARLLAVRFSAGDLWIVGATVSWVAYSLLLKIWPTRLTATERLCGMAGGGLLVMLPFVVAEWLRQPVAIAAAGWGLIVLAGLLPGLASYLAYGFLQQELGAGRAALVMYLAPVYAALLAWWLLGEPPRWYHGVGALLILPSIQLAGRRPAGDRKSGMAPSLSSPPPDLVRAPPTQKETRR